MEFAELQWREGVPYSPRFDDIYFSRDGGRAETEHVFLAQNGLPERFPSAAGEFFTIGETGFGTGLNFVTTWQIWREQPRQARLHFVSVEKYPLAPDVMAALWQPMLASFPEAREFIAQYHSLTPGWNRFSFADAELTLYIGDATKGLQDLDATVDAWFLDGFTPAKNADLWSPTVFNAMASCSHPGTTLSSFTAALGVREQLAAAGFKVEKCQGFGHKRTMIRGRFVGFHGPMQRLSPTSRWPRLAAPLSSQQQVGIVGSGVAAAELATRLRQRGFEVVLFSPDGPGSAASGNGQGAVYAKPGIEADPATQFYAQSLSYRTRLWQAQGQEWPGNADGLLQLTTLERCARIAANSQHPFAQLMRPVSAEQASELAGITLVQPALYFSQGGWLAPNAYCQQQLQGIEHIRQRVIGIEFDASTAQWVVTTQSQQEFRMDGLIIAAGQHSNGWPVTAHLPIKPVRGQVSAVQTSEKPPHQCVLCGETYLTPPDINGQWHFGASFDVGSDHTNVLPKDSAENRLGLARLAPDVAAFLGDTPSTERAGVRATTPDYLPMAGPVRQPLQTTRKHPQSPIAHSEDFWPRLAVLTGLGSKGLASSALAAEQVLCYLTGEPSPMGHAQGSRLHPERFWWRQQQRKSKS